MPELPEVETLRGQLEILEGKRIKSAKVDWPKTVMPLTVRQFQLSLKNQTIKSVQRRAKALIFELSQGYLLVHLKMTGQLIYQPARGQLLAGGHPQPGGLDNLPNKFTRVVVELSSGVLYFNDMRKFGWMRLVNRNDLDEFCARFGPEALEADFNSTVLKTLLGRYSNRKIKQVLLDQKLIAGFGNIYADEACFSAGVLPSRQAKDIKPAEISKIVSGAKKIFRQSIERGGTSFSDYVQIDGQRGGFVPYLKVYGRQGDKCRRRGCRGVIEKIKQNGRGTHFCPYCQK